jgi:hypothetical protein
MELSLPEPIEPRHACRSRLVVRRVLRPVRQIRLAAINACMMTSAYDRAIILLGSIARDQISHLLSREREVAIARRVEAGRWAVIVGLCGSSLQFRATVFWREESNDGETFLREVTDVEATFAGPGAQVTPIAAVAASACSGSSFRWHRVESRRERTGGR